MCSRTSKAPIRSKASRAGIWRASICTSFGSTAEAISRVRQAGCMKFSARQTRPRPCAGHRAEDHSAAAADFEIARRCGKKARGETGQEAAARLEPEMTRFGPREFSKRGCVEFRLRRWPGAARSEEIRQSPARHARRPRSASRAAIAALPMGSLARRGTPGRGDAPLRYRIPDIGSSAVLSFGET